MNSGSKQPTPTREGMTPTDDVYTLNENHNGSISNARADDDACPRVSELMVETTNPDKKGNIAENNQSVSLELYLKAFYFF